MSKSAELGFDPVAMCRDHASSQGQCSSGGQGTGDEAVVLQLSEQDLTTVRHGPHGFPEPLPLPLVIHQRGHTIQAIEADYAYPDLQPSSTHLLGHIPRYRGQAAACMKAVLQAVASGVFAPASVIMHIGPALREAAFGLKSRMDPSVQLALDFLQRLPLVELGSLAQSSSMQDTKQPEHRSVIMPQLQNLRQARATNPKWMYFPRMLLPQAGKCGISRGSVA